MTHPDSSPDIPSDRAALREFALRLGVQAAHLTGRAARWRERTTHGGSLDTYSALDALDRFDKAHRTLTTMAAQLAVLPADADTALGLAGDTPDDGPPGLRRAGRDAGPDGLPVPADDLKAAVETSTRSAIPARSPYAFLDVRDKVPPPSPCVISRSPDGHKGMDRHTATRCRQPLPARVPLPPGDLRGFIHRFAEELAGGTFCHYYIEHVYEQRERRPRRVA